MVKNKRDWGYPRVPAKPTYSKQNRISSSVETAQNVKRLRLQKPINGKYVLVSASRTGKQRFIQSRVKARLLHQALSPKLEISSDKLPSTGKIASSISRKQVSGEKVPVVMRNTKKTNSPVLQRTVKLQNSSIKVKGIKTPRKVIKTLGHVVKSIPQDQSKKEQSHSPLKAIKTSARHAQHVAHQLQVARRSRQGLQAAMRLSIRLIRLAVKLAAMLVKATMTLLGGSTVVIVILCIVLAAAAIVTSPLGIFVSNENLDPDVRPLTQIIEQTNSEFTTRLEDIRQSAGPVDRVEMEFVGSADNTRVDNWPDVVAIFAVKTTMTDDGLDVATLDETRVNALRSIFWDMNQFDSYVETIEHHETVTVVHDDRSKSQETVTSYESVLHILITARTAEQQAIIYGFSDEQVAFVEEMLSAEYRPLMFALLGQDAGIGVTTAQLDQINKELPLGKGGEAVKLALSRLGDPYSQPKAGQERYTDCSYLVQWTFEQLGISLPRTAAEQARYFVENGLTVRFEDLAPGDLIFWSYEYNGRFMNVTHVGIYAGDGKVVDASSSRGQVVYRNLFDADKQVLYSRPNFFNEFKNEV